jgi:hypothetical protein
MSELDPSRIMQIGMGFFASKALLSAVELGLFTELAKEPMNAAELAKSLQLNPRAVPDFPDALVALKFLERDGDGPNAVYSNTKEGAVFLDRNSPSYVGGILEMANARLYRFWADLTEALRTGAPQNEIKHSSESMFAKLYEDPARLEQFMKAMAGISTASFKAFAEKFDFANCRTLCDVGGATGQLSLIVAAAHPHLSCMSFDLPQVVPIAERNIAMGKILHDWNLEKKKALIEKAYAALPEGGAFVAIEALIDDARRENDFGLLMSLNMLIEFWRRLRLFRRRLYRMVPRGRIPQFRDHPAQRSLERGGRLQITGHST